MTQGRLYSAQGGPASCTPVWASYTPCRAAYLNLTWYHQSARVQQESLFASRDATEARIT